MPYSDGNYLTEKGRALLAKLMASQAEIEFTRASVGSGTIPKDKSPKEMETLASWQVDGAISDISSPVSGEAHIVFQVFSRDVKVGFLATEAAIWANDPDEGEILYTYIALDNNPEWIRAANDPVQKFAEFTCINLVGTAPVDMTVINPEAIASRQSMLETIAKHNSDKSAHSDIRAEMRANLDDLRAEIAAMDTSSIIQQSVTIPTTGWVQSDPEEYEGLSADIPVEGVTGDMVPIVIVPPKQLKVIGERKFSPCVKSDDGYIRLYAKASPPEPIDATLVILCTSGGIIGGGGSYQLPTASADKLGGVKIGENISITDDGTISVNSEELASDIVASNKDAEEIITRYFGKT